MSRIRHATETFVEQKDAELKQYIDTKDTDLTNKINVLLEKAVTGCEYKSILNLNDITKTDLYQYSDFSTEGRVGAPDNYVGVVFHKQLASGYAFQTAWSMSGKRYERKQLASIWSDWEPQPTATKTDISSSSLLNGWTMWGNGYGDNLVGCKTGKQVQLNGLLRCGVKTQNTLILTLPEELRPTCSIIKNVSCYPYGAATIEIQSVGNVLVGNIGEGTLAISMGDVSYSTL